MARRLPYKGMSMDKQKIINKHFSRAIMGYDVEEVDAFLDELIRDMDRADQELGVAKLRIRMLLGELQEHGLLKGRALEPDGTETADAKTQDGGEARARETAAEEEAPDAREKAAKDE